MGNPYLITGPALISFSGGRTSAYMLYQILQAHGGNLPDDVVVAFANTGKEREETLRFVHECGVRWGVRIVWLEWRTRPMGKDGRNTPAEDRFEIVGFNSASRNGEPFKALIERKQFLPNAVTRFCTSHLKVDTMKQFMMSLGYEAWTNAIGLRYDEGHRVLKQLERNAKQLERNAKQLERFVTVMPLADKAVKVTARDIWQFWLGDNRDPKNLTHSLPQGFDLGLYPYEGNCDGCFLKGYQILAHQERERPGYLDDWIGMEARATELAEKPTGARFVTEYSYADIQAHVARQPLLIPLDWRNLEYDVECGLTCAGEAA